MRRRYSEEVLRYIENQAKLGVSVSSIADTFNVSVSAIHHVLSRNDIKFCRNPVSHIENEVWLGCLNIPDISVSNMGRFLRMSTSSIIAGFITTGGYVTVDFSGVGCFSAHRLVAQVFLQNLENKPEVNHKNGIKTDNRVDNLEWVTALENNRHAIQTGLRTFKSGQDHHRTALNIEQIQICSQMRAEGKTYLEIGNVMGVHPKTVSNHLKS